MRFLAFLLLVICSIFVSADLPSTKGDAACESQIASLKQQIDKLQKELKAERDLVAKLQKDADCPVALVQRAGEIFFQRAQDEGLKLWKQAKAYDYEKTFPFLKVYVEKASEYAKIYSAEAKRVFNNLNKELVELALAKKLVPTEQKQNLRTAVFSLLSFGVFLTVVVILRIVRAILRCMCCRRSTKKVAAGASPAKKNKKKN